MFCSKCGKKIDGNGQFCSSCGTGLDNSSIQIYQKVNSLITGGWISMGFGLLGILIPLVTILNEQSKWGKYYDPSIGLIAVIIISVLLLCTGLILLGWGHKNKVLLWVLFGIMVWTGILIPIAIIPLILALKLSKKKTK